MSQSAFIGAVSWLGTMAIAAVPQLDPAISQGFRDSLPREHGTVVVSELDAPVEITRDEQGRAAVHAVTLLDALCGQGYLHGQDRFFQMDLLRRVSSGRLAALVGTAGVSMDRRYRPLGCDAVAARVFAALPPRHRAQLESYTAGVNAGLSDLSAHPPEYILIGAQPEPWRPQDAILVQLTMFDMLHHNEQIERRLAVMTETLPPALTRFLTPIHTRFATPLIGDEHDGVLALPGPDVIDLRRGVSALPSDDLPDALVAATPIAIGSNNWAVARARSRHEGAILANDPHLAIGAPAIWYRVELEWADGWAGGVSLPGSPGVLIGSNRHLAWGMTNTMADFKDLIVIVVDPADDGRYRTAAGAAERFDVVEETIDVHRAAPVTLTVRRTRWGPVVDEDHHGRPLALRWTAINPDMVNLGVLDMVHMRTLEDALAVGRTWYGPSQNVLIATQTGRIGWVVSGYLPRRVGFDGATPADWSRPDVAWRGPLPEDQRPTIIDPDSGVLFTANQRTVGSSWARTLGNAWALAARAHRIQERLAAQPRFDERELLAIQLDTRVVVFDLYRDLFADAMRNEPAGSPGWRAFGHVTAWDGTSDADQPGLLILDRYRRGLHEAIVAPLVVACRVADPSFRYEWSGAEECVRRLLEVRPDHLCPPADRSWDDLVKRVAREVVVELLVELGDVDALGRSWGDSNRSAFEHPLAMAIPALGPFVNLPATPLPGHPLAVRVATPRYGASMRMVVSPGREASGILHNPGGQSGHPLSPHYRDAHAAWLNGQPTPFRVGPAATRIRLVP